MHTTPKDSPTVRRWLQSRLDILSNQFKDALNGLEGIVLYDHSNPNTLYAEYRLSGYSASQIEYFQQQVGFYLHEIIDSYRSIHRPPNLLYIKHHRITIEPPV